MKKEILLFFSLFIGFVAFSQTKQFTIKEAVISYNLYPERISGVKWQTNNEFTYVKDWSTIMQVNAKTAKESSLLKLDDLNKVLAAKKLPEMRYIADYNWYSKDAISFNDAEYFVVYNVTNSKVEFFVKTDKDAANQHFCEENNTLAYTIDNNLYLANKDKSLTITNDKDKGIVNGDAYVHRQEFGIDKGIFWSPKGSLMAFYRKDETMVADYPLVDVTTRIATENSIKYPMAGETSEQVTLGVYNVNKEQTVFLKTKKDDHYLARISWDPSEQFVYIAELNRGQNHMSLNKYDVNSGEFIQTLFEEKHPKYVEPENDMIFMKTKTNQFLWFSERDGFSHLYLFNTSGKLIKQITKGNWVVTDFFLFHQNLKNQ